mmetsp:Transcript_21026/g.53090  ORF Transcript_21026/g.53090 Transcript_21026/m.53090 type:complete len:204 (-) Transcript_21026:274-885(-)
MFVQLFILGMHVNATILILLGENGVEAEGDGLVNPCIGVAHAEGLQVVLALAADMEAELFCHHPLLRSDPLVANYLLVLRQKNVPLLLLEVRVEGRVHVAERFSLLQVCSGDLHGDGRNVVLAYRFFSLHFRLGRHVHLREVPREFVHVENFLLAHVRDAAPLVALAGQKSEHLLHGVVAFVAVLHCVFREVRNLQQAVGLYV